ncbi:MAG: FMN-binding negative transcriptional regulator [Methylobacteriaceae bacterium]|nr:FMN-binding negative transcriptional regulator [Methylobacteriaceae bacterium]
MYQPPHFQVTDEAALHRAVRAHPLGLLITAGAGGLMANPVPFLLIEGSPLRLVAHVARANAQWREIGEGLDALVVFQGADAYVSPGWYAAKREHGKVVPTWNYVIVQARGRARIHDDRQWLRTQVGMLTDHHEERRAEPWAVRDAPDDFVAAQLKGIVGIEIEVSQLVGKAKLSQNRGEADRAGVREGLAAESDPVAQMIGRLMDEA